MRRSLGGRPAPPSAEVAESAARRRVGRMVDALLEDGEEPARRWLRTERRRAQNATRPSAYWRAYEDATAEACEEALEKLGAGEHERGLVGLPLFEAAGRR